MRMWNTRKSGVLLMAVIVMMLPVVSSAATVQELQNQVNSIDEKIAESQKAAEESANTAASLEQQISDVEKSIASTQTIINDTNTQIKDVNTEIAAKLKEIESKENDIAIQTSNMNQTLIEIYRSSRKSNLEKLLASDDLAQAVQSTSQLTALEQQINENIVALNKAKEELEKSKSDLDAKKTSLSDMMQAQQNRKNSLDGQRKYKDGLMSSALADKETYEALVQKLSKEKASVSAALFAQRQKESSSGGQTVTTGGSGYPYSAIDVPDPWGFLTRECTSYAAWYWNNRLGKTWLRGEGPSGTGNAKNWPNLAARNGASVSSTPRVGAIISWTGGTYGHVAIVEKVNSNGTIDVSEFNWVSPGYIYSYRGNVNPSAHGSHVYIY